MTYGSTKTGTGIPAFSDWETLGSTRIGLAAHDVGEAFVALAIQPRVQEAERWFAGGD